MVQSHSKIDRFKDKIEFPREIWDVGWFEREKRLGHTWELEESNNPVAMVFARETRPELASLITKLDAETVKNADKKMGSFAIFCNDEEALPTRLKTLAKDLRKFVLAIDNPKGSEPYNIAKDADVTVVLYNKSNVIASYTFKKGELRLAS